MHVLVRGLAPCRSDRRPRAFSSLAHTAVVSGGEECRNFPPAGQSLVGLAKVARGGVRLLKFYVCWDAAVCAVSVGGFFNV
jgi:hypothetical protein